MENKYYCSNCKGIRKHETLFLKSNKGSEEYDSYLWLEKFLVIECSGCSNISFAKIYGDTEMVDWDDYGNEHYYFDTYIYPPYLEGGRELTDLHILPGTILTAYTETINALKIKSYILAAAGFRIIIEATCNHLKIKKSELAQRINSLYENGHLTQNESKRLHSIRFLGNDALHETEKPQKEQLTLVLEIVNHLLENLFIQDKKIENKIEVIIEEYPKFLILLKSKIHNDLLGEKITINDILGKSIRLIKKEHLTRFESTLHTHIQDGSLDFLSIVSSKNKTIYKIEKIPSSFSF